ncbi:hypothetical protein H7K13_23815 [Priestia aryabhattai]|uniref:hypothetical protein n=1 Tax=Priestia aryabhattai TaxID=412384 RepID=UPI001C8EA315|nr:hypothetical protein [Priestia aryabhattai]MBY0077957.1 hypothetical protein [Priestia aryabhattai]
MKKDIEQALYQSSYTNLDFLDSDNEGYTYEATDKHGRTYIVFVEAVQFGDETWSYIIQPLVEQKSESYKWAKRKKALAKLIGCLSFAWLILTFISMLLN